MKKVTTIAILLNLTAVGLSVAQHKDVKRPDAWKNIATGARFMDRFEPLASQGKRKSDTWGEDAVKPRDIKLGIEDPDWSYWGGNIVVGDDGKYHQFVCRWPENNPKGHGAWPKSELVHAVSDHSFGPFKVQEAIGRGHNPEIYRLSDGRYVCYVIGAYYLGKTINGPWERKKFEFDARDRRVVAGLTNLTFAQRNDGSFLMINRGGGAWVSRDGLGPWEQVTQGSNYPKVKGAYEDAVVWRTEIQYHMIVNDWRGRIAYHLRSKDGASWKVDSGEAYQPGIAVYADGQKEDWYKYERVKILQDQHKRAIQANFAVIDCPKREDQAKDNHSSKNLPIPLTPGRLLTLLNVEISTDQTKEIRLRISAEKGFNPHTDIDLESLRYGAPEEVDFGRGSSLLKTEKVGKDLIAVFSAIGNGFSDHNFAGKLLGQTSKGKLLFGYSRLPWVSYDEPILSARNPKSVNDHGKLLLQVEVTNYGLSTSTPSGVSISIADEDQKTIAEVQGQCPKIDPWGRALITIDAPSTMKSKTVYHYTVTTAAATQHPLIYKTYIPKKKPRKR